LALLLLLVTLLSGLTAALALLLVLALVTLALLRLTALLATLLAALALLLLISHAALLVALIVLVGHIECSWEGPRARNDGTTNVVPVLLASLTLTKISRDCHNWPTDEVLRFHIAGSSNTGVSDWVHLRLLPPG
jgi:hypothetical protein